MPGMAAKPDDRWTTPLCHTHHMHQHSIGEQAFWKYLRINPFNLCRALWEASGDLIRGREIVRNFRHGREK